MAMAQHGGLLTVSNTALKDRLGVTAAVLGSGKRLQRGHSQVWLGPHRIVRIDIRSSDDPISIDDKACRYRQLPRRFAIAHSEIVVERQINAFQVVRQRKREPKGFCDLAGVIVENWECELVPRRELCREF